MIYGSDTRRQYYEIEDARWRELMIHSVAVLMNANELELALAGELSALRTSGQKDGLCAGEPFATEPAAGFCTGTLVDWDLVLTAGHCVDDVKLDDTRVVFGYLYLEEGVLSLSRSGVFRIREVVAARADSRAGALQLDYAWLRLANAVAEPLHPVAMLAGRPHIAGGDPVLTIGGGGGVPLKLDAGGRVRDSRSHTADYFVADTDTSDGWSGGGAFDENLALVGILARGAQDYVGTAAGCRVAARIADPAQAREQYTYAFQAVSGLCRESTGALCESSCEGTCRPPASPEGTALIGPSGCNSLGRAGYGRLDFALLGLGLALALAKRRP